MAKAIYSVSRVVAVLIEVQPPLLFVQADGFTRSSGWTSPGLRHTSIGQQNHPALEFSFEAEPPAPGTVVMEMLTRASAQYFHAEASAAREVRVSSETNSVVTPITGPVTPTTADLSTVASQFSNITLAGGESPIPWKPIDQFGGMRVSPLLRSSSAPQVHDIPVCVTGSLSPIGFDTCMDATHRLFTVDEQAVRIRPNSEQVGKQLDAFSGKRILVTVCGTTAWGPECGSYLLAISVHPMEQFLARIT